MAGMRLNPAPRLDHVLLGLALPLLLVMGCGNGSSGPTSPAGPAGPSAAQGAGQSAGPASGAPSPGATLAKGPVPPNTVSAPLPTDAPATVRTLAPLPSCGGQILFEPDPDISPLPTPPVPPSSLAANRQAADCLIWAWENGKPAQLAVSAISDEQDEIYSLYRLPGDGTVDLLTRVKSHPDQAVSWTDATCKQLSLQGEQVTPAECSPETPLN